MSDPQISPYAYVVIGRFGNQEPFTHKVYVLPAHECMLRFSGTENYVLWSRRGNFLTSEQERKTKSKGGEYYERIVASPEHKVECLPYIEACDRAQELRDQLFDDGEAAE